MTPSHHIFYAAKVRVTEIRDETNPQLTWTRIEVYDLNGDQVTSIQFINEDASAEWPEWSYQRWSDGLEKLHAEARAFMERREDLAPMSLDEWLLEHDDRLSANERMEGNRLLRKFPEYGGHE